MSEDEDAARDADADGDGDARSRSFFEGVPPGGPEYRHAGCGGVGRVPSPTWSRWRRDADYRDAVVRGVWLTCAHCGDLVHMDELIWTDTDQSVYAWRRERLARLPLREKVLRMVRSPAGWAVSGSLLLGFHAYRGRHAVGWIAENAPAPRTLAGAVAGFGLGWFLALVWRQVRPRRDPDSMRDDFSQTRDDFSQTGGNADADFRDGPSSDAPS